MSRRSRFALILSSRCTCHVETYPSYNATLGSCSRALTASARGSTSAVRAVSLTRAWKGEADVGLRQSLRCSCELAVAERESALSRLDVTSHRSARSRAITCNPEHRTLDPLSPEAQSPKSCCHKKIV